MSGCRGSWSRSTKRQARPRASPASARTSRTSQKQGRMELSIITLGHVHAEDLAALTLHFTRIEQLVLDIHPRAPLSKHRAELNRAVDASSSDWILMMREPETVDEALAHEIVDAANR